MKLSTAFRYTSNSCVLLSFDFFVVADPTLRNDYHTSKQKNMPASMSPLTVDNSNGYTSKLYSSTYMFKI